MFAVIKTGGKQYRVAANDELEVELLTGRPVKPSRSARCFSSAATTASPSVRPSSRVHRLPAEIVDQIRTRKILVFKKRRRQNSKRSRGHRQHLTVVRITEILTGGASASAKKAKAPAKAEKAEPAALVSGTALDSSNLSLISGVGPMIEKKLRAAGVTNWEQIAGWTEADVAKYDGELELRGRATREEWVEQAQELLAGKPPRAKVDQEELASGEDR